MAWEAAGEMQSHTAAECMSSAHTAACVALTLHGTQGCTCVWGHGTVMMTAWTAKRATCNGELGTAAEVASVVGTPHAGAAS